MEEYSFAVGATGASLLILWLGAGAVPGMIIGVWVGSILASLTLK